MRSISSFPGIGPKKTAALKILGIETVEDLLRRYPRRYEDRRSLKKICELNELADGDSAAVRAAVLSVSAPQSYFRTRSGRKPPIKVKVGDGTGTLLLVFFGGAYLKNAFEAGQEYFFYGQVRKELQSFTMLHPEFEKNPEDEAEKAQSENVGRIVPFYPLVAGLTQKEMRRLVKAALEEAAEMRDVLPPEIAEKEGLSSLEFSLENIHFPAGESEFKAARRRLVFEELFLLQAGLIWLRQGQDSAEKGICFEKTCAADFEKLLPFEMTSAQKRATAEIYMNMESQKSMHRLLQGDVGSGKTAVAMAACYKAALSGYQSVLMAPTEILASQHYAEFRQTFGEKFRIAFLASSVQPKEKEELKRKLAAGEIDMLIATHAVLQDDVVFARLGLVVTDEQHRFGVAQRLRLKEKGIAAAPDVLVTSATPIPRTLALLVYGDLDISILDELPPGRKPVDTRFTNSTKRAAVYDFAAKEIAKGRQVYVVAPMIAEQKDGEDEDEKAGSSHYDDEILPYGASLQGLASAEGLYTELKTRFPSFRIGLLHGALKQKEKEDVMGAFARGEIDLLCATVVIEVGISVANATVMVIENAERFGLSQLHQLRGRVGRGAEKSYCILLSDSSSEIAARRCETLASTNDGFRIAEMDLELRGPGDFFGTRQHGLPELKIADLAKHIKTAQEASADAHALFEKDPQLALPEHALLKEQIAKMACID